MLSSCSTSPPALVCASQTLIKLSLSSPGVRGNLLPADRGWIRLLLRLPLKHPEWFTAEQQELWHSAHILTLSHHGREHELSKRQQHLKSMCLYSLGVPVSPWGVQDAVKPGWAVHSLSAPQAPPVADHCSKEEQVRGEWGTELT